MRLAELAHEGEDGVSVSALGAADGEPAVPAAAPAAPAGRIDLDAIVASVGEDEPSVVRTDGAVRPTDALPPDAPSRAPGEGAP